MTPPRQHAHPRRRRRPRRVDDAADDAGAALRPDPRCSPSSALCVASLVTISGATADDIAGDPQLLRQPPGGLLRRRRRASPSCWRASTTRGCAAPSTSSTGCSSRRSSRSRPWAPWRAARGARSTSASSPSRPPSWARSCSSSRWRPSWSTARARCTTATRRVRVMLLTLIPAGARHRAARPRLGPGLHRRRPRRALRGRRQLAPLRRALRALRGGHHLHPRRRAEGRRDRPARLPEGPPHGLPAPDRQPGQAGLSAEPVAHRHRLR